MTTTSNFKNGGIFHTTLVEDGQKMLFFDDYQSASVSLIIPVHNEDESISPLLEEAIAVMKGLGRPWEIIVVDDGSTDQTLERLRDKEVRVIAHPYNIGNGAAIKTGIRYASGEIIVMMDGDGQHDPQDIPKLIAQIGPYDMVVGARTNGFSENKHRTFANHFFNLFATY